MWSGLWNATTQHPSDDRKSHATRVPSFGGCVGVKIQVEVTEKPKDTSKIREENSSGYHDTKASRSDQRILGLYKKD